MIANQNAATPLPGGASTMNEELKPVTNFEDMTPEMLAELSNGKGEADE